MREDRIYTRTWYGHGQPLTAEETLTRIREAFNQARDMWPKVWFGSEEDAFFEPDNNGLATVGPIKDLDGAMAAWWNHYGSCDSRGALIERGFGDWIKNYGDGMIEEE